jgi:hypothetical protein
MFAVWLLCLFKAVVGEVYIDFLLALLLNLARLFARMSWMRLMLILMVDVSRTPFAYYRFWMYRSTEDPQF